MKHNNKNECCDASCGEMEVPFFAEIGHQIPDLEVEAFHNEEIKKIKFSNYRGKWLVLFFYPRDFSFVCPTELEEMAEYYDEIQKLNGEVLAISTDSVFVHKAWHDTSEAIKKVKFPMLADTTQELCEMFGILIEKEGVSLRGTFIVDPDGILRTVEVNDNDIGRSARELVRKIQAAKFVHEHGGNVCPASWEPGDDTLRPGLHLVGKI